MRLDHVVSLWAEYEIRPCGESISRVCDGTMRCNEELSVCDETVM